jgi:hypothetical protein
MPAFVDEGDPRHQERVGCELDHLGRVHIRAHDRRLDLSVETRDGVTVVIVERADRDPVGMHEVAHCASLGEKLRIRDVADVLEASLVEARTHLLARADRHGRLHHENRPAGELRQLIDHGPDAGQIRIARIGRRRVHTNEQEVARRDVPDVECVGQPLGVSREQLGNTLLVKRNVAAPKCVDLLGDDVADHDLVAELGEACARDEAHPTCSENADLAHRAPETSERLLGV